MSLTLCDRVVPTRASMTKPTKIVNLAAVVLPFLATLAAIVLLWNSVVSWHDLAHRSASCT